VRMLQVDKHFLELVGMGLVDMWELDCKMQVVNKEFLHLNMKLRQGRDGGNFVASK
jgi:hypothetical protein